MNAREQIVRVLEEVFEQGAYSNIALNQALDTLNFQIKIEALLRKLYTVL